MRRFAFRFLSFTGGMALIAGALFHASGLPMADAAAQEVRSPFMQTALRPLWLFPSNHWGFYGVLVLISGWASSIGRIVTAVIGLSVLIDAAMMAVSLPGFIGGYILAAAGLLTITASIIRPRQRSTDFR